MKRKVMLVTLAVILCSLFVTGGTLAYLTAQNQITNSVTAGKIQIAIDQTYEKAVSLAPSQTVENTVRIQNQGNDAYVRVTLSAVWGTQNDDGFQADASLSAENIRLNLNLNDSSAWRQVDGTYYIRLDAGELSENLLESFTFVPSENGNSYQGKTIRINVEADAIQIPNKAMEASWKISYDETLGAFTKVVEPQPQTPNE